MISDPAALLAFMFGVIAFARFLEGRVAFVKKISSAVVCTLLGMLLGNIGVLPHEGPVNEGVYDFAVPYSIVLVILASNLRELKQAGTRMLGCFALATVATFVACVAAGLLFARAIGPETWKISGQFAGAFVGGGMNFVAVGRGLETSPSLFAAASVADNLSTVPYMLAQMGLAAILTARFRAVPIWRRNATAATLAATSSDASVTLPADIGNGPSNDTPRDPRRFWTDAEISISDLAILAAAPLAAIWLSARLAPLIPGFPTVLWLTTLAFVAAQFPFFRTVKGASVLSYFALHLFFIVIGAGAVFAEVLKAGPALFVYMLVILVIHVVLAYGVAWLVGYDIPNISIASQAAVGGPGSALALSMAMNWPALATPGIIVGILGYAIGNYVGFGCAYLLRGYM
ncbi:MAG TPA: DUF819 family protein [Vicinamibacterales bacterium]|nr:DUF819 family protein [Vicinamibacterales bacterium]